MPKKIFYKKDIKTCKMGCGLSESCSKLRIIWIVGKLQSVDWQDYLKNNFVDVNQNELFNMNNMQFELFHSKWIQIWNFLKTTVWTKFFKILNEIVQHLNNLTFYFTISVHCKLVWSRLKLFKNYLRIKWLAVKFKNTPNRRSMTTNEKTKIWWL